MNFSSIPFLWMWRTVLFKSLFYCHINTQKINPNFKIFLACWLTFSFRSKFRQSSKWYTGLLGCWVVGRTTDQPSVWCSKYDFFHNFSQNSLQKSKLKSFECSKTIRNYKRKTIVVISDAWLMSCLSNRSSNPAHYDKDCLISTSYKLTRREKRLLGKALL